MRICIIAEGCYPYVRGGVSSWIQMLIRYMKDDEFIILAIGASEAQKGQFRMEIPPNVVEIKEIFLDSMLNEEMKMNRGYRLTKGQKKALTSLILNEEVDWDEIFSLFHRADKSPVNFLLSKSYIDIMEKICSEKYPYVPFNDFFWNTRSMVIPLLHLIREGTPEADLYHSVSTGYAGVLAALGKYIYKKPVIISEHGIYAREREEEIIQSNWVAAQFKMMWIQFFYLLSKVSYERADAVTSLFEHARALQIELGCDEKKTLITPNGVDMKQYAHIAPRAPDYDIQIGAIVRVVPIKDIKTMLYAFDYIKKVIPSAHLKIIGPYEEDIEYYQECLSLIDTLNVQDVRFLGFCSLADELSNVDIVLLTSVSEGQPISILETMAAGLPTVATNVGCCRELLEGAGKDKEGRCGICVPVMNPKAIADAVITLCKDLQLRLRMGQVGRKRVETYYQLDVAYSRYVALYERVLKSWQASISN